MLNKVFLQGRLGADPEMKVTPSGTEVTTVNIAVDRDRKDANGERQTDWVTIIAWRQTAKFLADYFKKGRIVIVEGRLQVRKYTDRDGNNRTVTEVVADNVYFGDSKRDEQGGGYGGNYSAAQSYAQGGGYNAPAYNAPTGYGMPTGDQFSELRDDNDGELPF